MESKSDFTVTVKAKRPGSDAHACFYCHEDVGGKHLETCVLINKRVQLKMTINYPAQVPASWDKDQINFHRNDSSWCSDNALDELQDLTDDDNCLCRYTAFEWISDIGDAYLNENGEEIDAIVIPDDEFGSPLKMIKEAKMTRDISPDEVESEEISHLFTQLDDLKTIKFDGLDFTIPKTNCPEWGNPTGFYIQVRDHWEKRISDEINALSGRHCNFVDIGANFGAYSFLAGRRFQGKVYAIEAFAPNYEILKYNVRRLPNVFPMCFAVGRECRLITFQVSSKNHGGHTCVIKRGRDNYQDTIISCVSMDMLAIDSCDVVKIDVEGYAVNVLKGFNRISEAWLVMIEIHDDKEREAVSIMEGHDFDIEHIEMGKRNGVICTKRKES